MMPPLYQQVRRYSAYIATVLIASFATVSVLVIWQEAEINESKYRNAAFHVPTVLHTGRIAKLLIRLEEEILADDADLKRQRNGQDHHEHFLPMLGQRQLYVVRKELKAIAALQARFGGARFQATLERVDAGLAAFARTLDAALSTPDTAARRDETRDQLTSLRTLILTVDQLERLHFIAHDEVDRGLEAQIHRRNAVVLPGAFLILLCGLIGMGYLTRQTKSALLRLETADRAVQDLNRDLEQRVEERTAELKAAQDELIRKERLAAVGQVTATVSHELRNPLGAIRSASDAIRKYTGDGDPRMLQALALLERSQIRCDKVITDLLDFTRIRELDCHLTRVDDWLGDLLEDCHIPSNFTLHRALDSGVETAFDRDRLEQAVRNVVENACHAMAERANGGAVQRQELTVATRVAKGRLELSFKDTGAGISADHRARIFEPLYSTKSIGVGLGLPMVKQVAEQHGGGIEITSGLARGTEVVLWLPLSVQEQEAVA